MARITRENNPVSHDDRYKMQMFAMMVWEEMPSEHLEMIIVKFMQAAEKHQGVCPTGRTPEEIAVGLMKDLGKVFNRRKLTRKTS